MSNPFAAVETAINTASMAVLNNATATIGLTSVSGVFDNGYLSAQAVAGSGPTFSALTASLTGASYGTSISIGGASYTVRGIEADGTGITRLVLEEA